MARRGDKFHQKRLDILLKGGKEDVKKQEKKTPAKKEDSESESSNEEHNDSKAS